MQRVYPAMTIFQHIPFGWGGGGGGGAPLAMATMLWTSYANSLTHSPAVSTF